MPVILANFPLATPKSNAKLKQDIVASSFVDEIYNLKPMPPDNRKAKQKIKIKKN